jgi:hypothetical protein
MKKKLVKKDSKVNNTYAVSVDVDRRKPTAKAGMGMVPSNHIFCSVGLLEHFKHFGLENWVD